MRARATQPSGVVTAHRERSDLSNSSTDPGFAFECLSPRRAIFDTVNAPYPTGRENFSAGRSRASRGKSAEGFYNNSVRLYIAHSRMLNYSLITKEFSTDIIYALTYFHYQRPQLSQTDNS